MLEKTTKALIKYALSIVFVINFFALHWVEALTNVCFSESFKDYTFYCFMISATLHFWAEIILVSRMFGVNILRAKSNIRTEKKAD